MKLSILSIIAIQFVLIGCRPAATSSSSSDIEAEYHPIPNEGSGALNESHYTKDDFIYDSNGRAISLKDGAQTTPGRTPVEPISTSGSIWDSFSNLGSAASNLASQAGNRIGTITGGIAEARTKCLATPGMAWVEARAACVGANDNSGQGYQQNWGWNGYDANPGGYSDSNGNYTQGTYQQPTNTGTQTLDSNGFPSNFSAPTGTVYCAKFNGYVEAKYCN